MSHHSAFHEILERLADEHEREVEGLRTEVGDLRTQLSVLDPAQKSSGRTGRGAGSDVAKRWGATYSPQRLGAQSPPEERQSSPPKTGIDISHVMQRWAEQKHMAHLSDRPASKPEEALEAELTGEVMPERSSTRPKAGGSESSDSVRTDTPGTDWPPPVPVRATSSDTFWVNLDDDNDHRRCSGHSRPCDDPRISGRDELAPDNAMELESLGCQEMPEMPQMQPQGNIMESQQYFREQEVRIKHDFEESSRMSNMMGVVASCFRVWSLLARHMRTRFCFELLEPWRGNCPTSTAAGGLPLSSAGIRAKDMELDPVEEEVEGTEVENATPRSRGLGCFILAPNATVRTWWDLTGTVLLLYDIIGIPLEAFDPDPHTFTTFMDYATLIFWTADIFMSCITGYVHRGVTIMEPKKIIRHYLKSLFLMDLVVVGPDWIFLLLMLSNGDSVNAGKGSNRLVRVMRVVRLARLLRLVKLARGLAMIRDRIESEVMFIVANIMKLIVMLLVVNHFLGSLWYLVGDLSKEAGTVNWIQVHGFEGASLHYRYFTSLHWSLTQFTPASMSVQPQNVYERMFAICCLVFGLVLFSSFISSITASMTQLRHMSEDKSKQFWLLRRYLRQRGIDKKLTYRILRYVEYAVQEKTVQVSESKVWSISLLSHQLREELQYEVSFKCLMSHPFFERAREVSSVSTFQLAEQALSVEMLASRDTLFNSGTAATHMFIVAYGQMKYLKMDELYLSALDNAETKLGKDDWACEQALWTKWTHLGCLRAVSEVRLVAIDVKKFEEVINKDPVSWDTAHTYGKKYVQWLNETARGDLTDVSHQTSMAQHVRQFLAKDKRTKMSVKALLDVDRPFPRKEPAAVVPRSL
mmetsp:Transcript_114373/g.356159  ORF Transcript_114373/g.356159 Transcript_114373/m.356159 type:complete len:866 (+) Transcript_114373:229-2826(+)